VAVNSTAGIVYVTVGGDDKVVFLDYESGAYINGTLENSSFATEAYPRGVAVNPAANLLYVSNLDPPRVVTFFNATTGAYADTDLAGSSVATDASCFGAAVNATSNLLYLTGTSTSKLIILNATTGAYLNGTLAASSFATGTNPYAVAVPE
jgi:DNA-binding beta-propeller fold protein YncE